MQTIIIIDTDKYEVANKKQIERLRGEYFRLKRENSNFLTLLKESDGLMEHLTLLTEICEDLMEDNKLLLSGDFVGLAKKNKNRDEKLMEKVKTSLIEFRKDESGEFEEILIEEIEKELKKELKNYFNCDGIYNDTNKRNPIRFKIERGE